ncbi:MAG: hypothetical protein KatS3mg111_1495 [Pirellulaceae bacterium]|nr:MAG: hypothetical protein KatS3mg111_1495 [Pirellulaceae bacterium]
MTQRSPSREGARDAVSPKSLAEEPSPGCADPSRPSKCPIYASSPTSFNVTTTGGVGSLGAVSRTSVAQVYCLVCLVPSFPSFPGSAWERPAPEALPRNRPFDLAKPRMRGFATRCAGGACQPHWVPRQSLGTRGLTSCVDSGTATTSFPPFPTSPVRRIPTRVFPAMNRRSLTGEVGSEITTTRSKRAGTETTTERCFTNDSRAGRGVYTPATRQRVPYRCASLHPPPPRIDRPGPLGSSPPRSHYSRPSQGEGGVS